MPDFAATPALRLVISLIGGVATYAVWYRTAVGPWCPAMWGGTAPPVITLFAAFVIWRALGRLPGSPG